jgi:methionyl aminopeptidase
MGARSNRIIIKNPGEQEKMRVACRLTAGVLREIERNIKPGITTGMIDQIAEAYIRAHGAVPTFKGYRGYPASACVSVNEELIHGIPGDRVLSGGDIVSVDIGVTCNGFIGDAARTYAVGTVPEDILQLIESARTAFFAGCNILRAGIRVGDISHMIQQCAEGRGYGVVRSFVGHGIGRQLHEPPEIPNYGDPGTGQVIPAGATLAIEPMITLGDHTVRILGDNWTVVTADRQPCAHYENTVLVTGDGYEILTDVSE